MGFDDFLQYARLMAGSTASDVRLGVTLGLIRCDAAAVTDARLAQLERKISDLIDEPVLAKRGSGR
jgi:hypothetical protein